MGMRRMLAVAACTVAVAALGAGSAFAGEVTGNGKPTPIGAAPENDPHASSICSFSGQNDGEAPLGKTQSYGTDVAAGRADPSTENPGKVGRGVVTFHPGFACNGNHGFFAGP